MIEYRLIPLSSNHIDIVLDVVEANMKQYLNEDGTERPLMDLALSILKTKSYVIGAFDKVKNRVFPVAIVSSEYTSMKAPEDGMCREFHIAVCPTFDARRLLFSAGAFALKYFFDSYPECQVLFVFGDTKNKPPSVFANYNVGKLYRIPYTKPTQDGEWAEYWEWQVTRSEYDILDVAVQNPKVLRIQKGINNGRLTSATADNPTPTRPSGECQSVKRGVPSSRSSNSVWQSVVGWLRLWFR